MCVCASLCVWVYVNVGFGGVEIKKKVPGGAGSRGPISTLQQQQEQHIVLRSYWDGQPPQAGPAGGAKTKWSGKCPLSCTYHRRHINLLLLCSQPQTSPLSLIDCFNGEMFNINTVLCFIYCFSMAEPGWGPDREEGRHHMPLPARLLNVCRSYLYSVWSRDEESSSAGMQRFPDWQMQKEKPIHLHVFLGRPYWFVCVISCPSDHGFSPDVTSSSINKVINGGAFRTIVL